MAEIQHFLIIFIIRIIILILLSFIIKKRQLSLHCMIKTNVEH